MATFTLLSIREGPVAPNWPAGIALGIGGGYLQGPPEPGDRSFRHSYRPSSEDSFRVDTPGNTLFTRWD